MSEYESSQKDLLIKEISTYIGESAATTARARANDGNADLRFVDEPSEIKYNRWREQMGELGLSASDIEEMLGKAADADVQAAQLEIISALGKVDSSLNRTET